MVIGLGPQYNYPGKYETWLTNNTKYASNLGASLISNTLLKQFNADFIDDFSNIRELKNKYDTCIIAFATHVTTWRDVSFYTDIIEKLDMKTVALSLGVQDYAGKNTDVFELHPSMKKLLKIVSVSSNWIGVRGHHTASILYQNGFSNVVPIGCPTLFWGLEPDLKITKPKRIKNPIIVYHRALAEYAYDKMQNIPILGQDYEDHVIFNNDLKDDNLLKTWITNIYEKMQHKTEILDAIAKNGIFVKDFEEWFKIIGQHDFVFGTRLHGCIAGLIQKKPTVMIPRDLRVNEIADFFDIPKLKLEDLEKLSIDEMFQKADYEKFNNTYKMRYKNYYNFIEENGLKSELQPISVDDYTFSHKDILTNNIIFNNHYAHLNKEIKEIKKDYYESGNHRHIVKLFRILKKFPFYKSFAKKKL